MNKSKSFKIVGVIVILLLFVIVTFLLMYQNKIKKMYSTVIDDIEIIQGLEHEIKTSLNEEFVYGSIAGDVIVDRISKKLQLISDYIVSIDEIYNDISSTKIIDDYISENINFNNWIDYKQYLNNNYLIANTPQYSANQLAQENGYSSADEYFASQKVEENDLAVSDIEYVSFNDKYKVTGTVTNNTPHTAYFIKVKISLIDKNGTVLNTDNTYACGDEGLASNESTIFECYVDKVDDVNDVKAIIYDYQ